MVCLPPAAAAPPGPRKLGMPPAPWHVPSSCRGGAAGGAWRRLFEPPRACGWATRHLLPPLRGGSLEPQPRPNLPTHLPLVRGRRAQPPVARGRSAPTQSGERRGAVRRRAAQGGRMGGRGAPSGRRDNQAATKHEARSTKPPAPAPPSGPSLGEVRLGGAGAGAATWLAIGDRGYHCKTSFFIWTLKIAPAPPRGRGGRLRVPCGRPPPFKAPSRPRGGGAWRPRCGRPPPPAAPLAPRVAGGLVAR